MLGRAKEPKAHLAMPHLYSVVSGLAVIHLCIQGSIYISSAALPPCEIVEVQFTSACSCFFSPIGLQINSLSALLCRSKVTSQRLRPQLRGSWHPHYSRRSKTVLLQKPNQFVDTGVALQCGQTKVKCISSDTVAKICSMMCSSGSLKIFP